MLESGTRKTLNWGTSSLWGISTPLPGPPHPLPEMGTTSSAPPGSSPVPAPSRPAGRPKLPASPPPSPLFTLPPSSVSTPASASPKRPARVEAPGPHYLKCPFAGVSRIRGPASRLRSPSVPPPARLRPPPMPRSPRPSPLRYPGRGPAPTAARKDAAWVPCQASECAAPPSRARNAAGRRGRLRHPALRPALSHRPVRQVAPARRGSEFLLEGKQDPLPFFLSSHRT